MNLINDESYFDLLIDNTLINLYPARAEHVFPVNPKASLMLVPQAQFEMPAIGTYPYAFFPSVFTLNSEICTNSNIAQIQSNPNFGLYGQGVLVAVIDTGIDYQHKAFRYPDGSSRIFSIWDQTIDTPPKDAPDGFYYGKEFTNEEINHALTTDAPLSMVPTTDEVGHGTMLAGIAGGTADDTNQFHGIVPQCEFVIVKLKPAKALNKQIFSISRDQLCFEETDVITALSYVTAKATALHRPLSICIAMGTSQGGHNGKGSTSGYLNYITQSPHMDIAVAGGNEGNSRRHFLGEILNPFFTDFELNVDEKDTSFPMEIWATSPNRLLLEITSPNGETLRNFYPRINECRKVNFIFNPTIIWLNNIVSESDTGDQLILLRFENATHGIWRFRAHSIDEEATLFHAWLPSNTIISSDTFFLNSNAETTITSPGNADTPLVLTNWNEPISAMAINSSRGYTRYQVIKPDLAAPGSNLLAPLPNDGYGTLSGTGASAAHASGVIAMVLEWAVVRGRYSTITGSDINRLLIRGAYRTKNNPYPNTIQGYGLLDIYGLFEKLI